MSPGEPPTPAPPPVESVPNRVKKLVSEWWQVVLAVAAVVVAVTTGILGQSTAQAIAVPAALVLVGLSAFGAWLWKRRRRRSGAGRTSAEDGRTDPGGPWAFLGPNPYRCEDFLPGSKRRKEVETVARAIADPTFRFGMVTGELGCGKTSFLDAGVRVDLQKKGFTVVLVGSPRELWPREPAPNAKPGWLGRAFDTRVKKLLPVEGSKVVLVIDQFEEFFADVKAADDLAGVGGLFEKLTADGVRVVLGLRRDYGLDVFSLSVKLPPPVPQKTLFKLEYLTPDDAAEVIRECAGRDERVKLDDEFPQAVANDLSKADDGLVRPIELQIVCNALHGSLRLADYRLAGGSRGILSRFIRVTVDACPHPQAGRKLLRAVSRFTDKVGAEPQTAGKLCDGIGLPDVTPQTVVRILRQFEAAKLLVREREGGSEPTDPEPRYRLAHHYLLGPIADVTRQEVTAADEADQYLTFHLTEKGSVVPFRRLVFIRRHASPAAKERQDVKHLIRRSWRVLAASLAAWVGGAAGAVLAIPLILAWHTSEKVWDHEVIAVHSTDGRPGNTLFHQFAGLPLEAFTDGAGRLRKWTLRDRVDSGRPEMAKLHVADVATGWEFTFGPNKRYILYRPDPQDRKIVALDTTKDTTAPTAFTYPERPLLAFNEDGDAVAATESLRESHLPTACRVWSLTEHKELGVVNNILSRGYRTIAVVKNPPRLVAFCDDERGHREVGLFDYTTGERLAYLSRGGTVPSFVVDAGRGGVYTTESVAPKGKPGENHDWVVRRWRLRDGTPDSITYKLPDGPRAMAPFLLQDESNIIVTRGDYALTLVAVLNPDNLDSRLPAGAVGAPLVAYNPMVAMWRAGDGVEIWSPNESATTRRNLAGFEWDSETNVVVRRDGKRLAALYPTGRLVLWDLETGTELKTLRAAAERSLDVWRASIFTSIADGCLCENTGPARVRLYDWDDGRVLADLTEVGGSELNRLVHFDGVSRQVYVWSDRGDVALYTERRQVFGRFRLWRTGHD